MQCRELILIITRDSEYYLWYFLPMNRSVILLTFTLGLFVSPAISQTPSSDHLSQEEVAAAAAAKPDTGFVYIQDAGVLTASFCQAQMPSEAIFTPAGWITAMSQNARRQYRPFQPTPDDTLRALTVVSKGCANGTAAGPSCETVSRAVLLSDKNGRVTVEAISQRPQTEAWQNGYGATAACSSLMSTFLMSDVKKVQNGKGEFLIATFNGGMLLKVYTVKEKHIKKLGL